MPKKKRTYVIRISNRKNLQRKKERKSVYFLITCKNEVKRYGYRKLFPLVFYRFIECILYFKLNIGHQTQWKRNYDRSI